MQKEKRIKMVKKSNMDKISTKALNLGRIKLKIKGVSPYLPEPMDHAVLERYDKKKSNKTYDKDDISETDKVKEKYYYTDDGVKGIPSRAFYNAMIRASSYLIDKKDGGMRKVREGIVVEGDVLPLDYAKEKVVEHWGRTSGSSRAPRKILRNAFYDWSVELSVTFNKSQISAEQIFNVLNWAGFHIGVGGFRKEKSGNYGMFSVDVGGGV